MSVTHIRHLQPLSVFALCLSLAGASFADEPAPAKAAKGPAQIQMDQAKALRLATLLESLPVLDELNVSDEVYAQLEDLKGQEQLATRQQMEELNRLLKKTRDLPAAEKAEAMRNFMQTFTTNRNAVSETHAHLRFNLLTGSQLERLQQIDLQDQGIGAFFNEEVVEGLKVTEDQQKRIDDIRATYEPKFLALTKRPFYAEKEVVRTSLPAVSELLKERFAKVEKVITKEQADKFAELRGPAFDLSRMERRIGGISDLELKRPRISPMLQTLLSHEAVRKDLKLNAEEEAGIAAAISKHQQAILAVYGPAAQARIEGEGEKVSAVKQALRREEQSTDSFRKSRKIEKEYDDELSKILKDTHLARLKQINWQKNPSFALMTDGREDLGLTPEQSEKMRAIQMESIRERIPPMIPAQNPEAAREFFAKQMERRKELQKKQDTQLLDVLTPEQRQKVIELQGPPFDVSLLDVSRQLPVRTATPTAPPPPAVEKPKQP